MRPVPTFQQAAPRYAYMLANMTVRPAHVSTLAKMAHRLLDGIANYQLVSAKTGVPALVIAAINERESSGSFTTWLYNGDPMRDRAGKPCKTVNVPKNLPVNPDISWTSGACLALDLDHLSKLTSWSMVWACYMLERYNGWGYWRNNRNSPYLWSFSQWYSSGKYVADGQYSVGAVDPQPGAIPLIRQMMLIHPELAIPAGY